MSQQPQFKRSTLAIAVALVLLTAAAGYSAFASIDGTTAPQAAPPAAAVSVAKVVEKEITEWDEFSGRLEAIESVVIRPRVSGTIDAVHFQDGALVKKGDLLFTIDARPYEAEVSRADAAVAAAQARVSYTKSQLDRARRLLDERAIAQREYDERENAEREAQANLRAVTAALESTRLNLEYTKIRAPISGRVSRAEITVGNLIAAGANAPALTSIVSVSPIYASFAADEQTFLKYANQQGNESKGAQRIAIQMGLSNEDAYPHKGNVKSIDNRLDATTGTIRLRAVFDNQDGALTPGLFAKLRMGGATQHQALLVNERAVGTDQNKKFVMVVGSDNKTSYREVRIGAAADGLRVVESGLKAGETIIVNGLQRVRPGDVVAPQLVAMDARPELQSKRPDSAPQADAGAVKTANKS